jgi:uncharacterized protein YndB with AHSA1/START domain
MNTDRIEKQTLLRAPRGRVWRALTDAEEFGTWFGMKFEGPFVAGSHVRGVIVPTRVDSAVAKAQQPYAGIAFDITIDRIEPETLFAFRWHPSAVERGVDYSDEPTTLVVFTLEDVAGGVRLTVTESGFDRIPLARRAKAFTANQTGWTMVMTLIEKHLAQAGISYTIHIGASLEQLWSAITSPDVLLKNWGAIESQWTEGSAVREVDSSGKVLWLGHVKRSEPPRLLSYTFDVTGSGEPPTEVVFELSAPVSPIAHGAQVVQLRVTQVGFESGSLVMAGCARAWPEILSSVKTYVETGRPLGFAWKH